MFIPSVDRDANLKTWAPNICSKTHVYVMNMEIALFLTQLFECDGSAVFCIWKELRRRRSGLSKEAQRVI
jgi:hypothetical protein